MKFMYAKYPGTCIVCEKQIARGSTIYWGRGVGAMHEGCRAHAENMRDPEYARGYNDTRLAQQAGPAGSAAREEAYLQMEMQWAREGFDY